MTIQKKSVSIAIAAVATVMGGVCPLAQAEQWVSGDFHQHTLHTDGSYKMADVFAKNNQYGLDWWANSEHGGTDRWKDLMNFWGNANNNWKGTMPASWHELQQLSTLYPNKTVIQGLEWNPAGHEHCSVGLITGQFDTNPNANALGQFEWTYGNGGSNADAAAMGWTATTATSKAKSLEAIAWLQANHQYQSWAIPAHTERANLFSVADLRNWNNAGPDVAFGFESMPGHQRSSGRGGYGGSAYGGGTTYGGTGAMSAKIGGLWDAMLGEGRNFWLFASSDFHSTGGDYWPGQYQRTWTKVQDTSPQSIVDGLRSGNNWVVMADIIDQLEFTADGAGKSSTMGQTLKVNTGENVTVKIKVHDPEGTNFGPAGMNTISLDHVDVIIGNVTGYVTPGTVEYSQDFNLSTYVAARFDAVGGVVDTNNLTSIQWTDLGGGWKEMSLVLNNVNNDLYIRLRGSNLGLGVTNETDGAGNPLADTLNPATGDAEAWNDAWFYANPIFVSVPEPATFGILSIGAGMMVLRRRSR